MDRPRFPHRHSYMTRIATVIAMLLALCGWTLSAQAQDGTSNGNNALPQVRVSTSEGAFDIRLRPDIAPSTVANFLSYVEQGFYDGTVFHRVIPGFMIQGGGFDENLRQKATDDPIELEASQTARNLRGTIAMARTRNPNSATSQFFINLGDNPHLNPSPSRPGYAVFGSVTQGMGVVDAIAGVETTRANGMSDVPADPVIIQSIQLVEDEQ